MRNTPKRPAVSPSSSIIFGPAVNADTAFDRQIYKLNLLDADAETVSTCLMLMRETASELRLDPRDSERDTQQARVDHAINSLLLAGQLAQLRPDQREFTEIATLWRPIGSVSPSSVNDTYLIATFNDRTKAARVCRLDPRKINL